MSQIQDQLEGLPGYDIVMDFYNDYAEEHFNNLNPYEDKEGNKVKLRSKFSTEKEKKLWKRIQSKAWVHDKCFLGSCGVGMDCGLGLAPLLVLILPAIGPIIMFMVHNRLIRAAAEELNMPNKLVANMETQILIDLIITFPPVIGSFFSWLNSCLTRNAAIIYKYMMFLADQREQNKTANYIGPRSRTQQQQQQQQHPQQHPQQQKTKYSFKKQSSRTRQPNQDSIVVGSQQQSGFI
ncbi:hypothetical protein HYPBUDRAFT_157841 [Hyphopichia burtonii NRRL Y-1933]|uniref:Uncharacterized protein n=1 Tax=Hyphopichia burtonii NRRL Y-1933 TaxID=984485 RepID=A0A1E4RHH8_9ASCO|nr:hypothetical protein HYPBUDRAFT_157841 [Hyphopichia burtonii NRRL Y-1933]ODV66719.1 hypothetical protein HYPBUDRAFT_157841 [Hyphopichia burtonii NRRL Y-1933]